MDFWISLCSQFEVGEQLTSLNHILGFLLQLPDDKDEGEANAQALAILWREIKLAPVRSHSVRRGIEARHPPASNPEEERGEDGGPDLQRGGSQRQRAATLQVHQRVLHGSTSRLSQLHRQGEPCPHYPVFPSIHVLVIVMAIANSFSWVDIQNNPESNHFTDISVSWNKQPNILFF